MNRYVHAALYWLTLIVLITMLALLIGTLMHSETIPKPFLPIRG